MKVAERQDLYSVTTANTNMYYDRRPRPNAISIQIPRSQPLAAVLDNMSYNRPQSPGSRRLNNPARASDSVANQYGSERHNSYTSPRGSVAAGSGVIPISTQTFINVPPPAGTTTTRPPEPRDARPEAYSGRVQGSYPERPRRSSLIDTQRSSISSGASAGSRSRPTIIQNDAARPTSPLKGSRDNDYYVTPSTTKEPRKVEHKKLYAVNEGTTSLVADISDASAPSRRHHRRRDSDSGDRGLYKGSSIDRERGERRGYHLNGPAKPHEKSIEDEDAYSYTDAAGMFRDTAPAWRESRPRRGSMDRSGASRERPTNMMDDPRKSNKEIGPPPSTRGWDKLNENLGRTSSMRDRPRGVPQSPVGAKVPQSPNRARVPQSPTRGRYAEPRETGDYYVPPRTSSADRHNLPAPGSRYDQHDYDERREPRRYERRNSVTRQDRQDRQDRLDQSVERRGFGIRAESQDRHAARGSDESFERQARYRDSGYGEPQRRDTAPELNYHEERRLEQEKNDRLAADRAKNEERERQWERESREKDTRRREDDRGYNRDYDRERDSRREREYDMDRERELQRERMMQPQGGHHHHQDSNHDRGYSKENGPRASGETIAQPGLSQAAAGGIAGAAAAYGLNKVVNRDDERDQQRDRASPRLQPPATHSDEGPPPQDRDTRRKEDRGLGFAFEHPPEPPRSAPPMNYPEPQQRQERVQERDFGQQPADDRASAAAPGAGVDAEEDYRRRMEQIQRELGRAPDDRNADSDPERERRKREREQRLRERELRNGDTPSVLSTATFDSQATSRMPGGYDNESVEGSTASRPGLTRKPSILDQAMTSEPAQIIDNSMSDRRENRVRIVDPPTEEEAPRPKGILKRPTQKFPEHPNTMREGVAPLKDVSGRDTTCNLNVTNIMAQATKSGIPPGARWTKIDRRLVNPEALEEAKERFEERLDCVIVLRVLTKEEIQKLADRTKELRGKYRHSHSSTSSTEYYSPSHNDDLAK